MRGLRTLVLLKLTVDHVPNVTNLQRHTTELSYVYSIGFIIPLIAIVASIVVYVVLLDLNSSEGQHRFHVETLNA